MQLKLSLLSGDLLLEKNGVATTVPIEIQSRPPPGVVASVESGKKPDQETQPRTPNPVTIPRNAPLIATNSIGMKLRLIDAGEFEMGSRVSAAETKRRFKSKWKDGFDGEHPVHRVRITKPFRIGVTEVTQAQWETVMGTKPWVAQGQLKVGPDFPVSCITWKEAQDFCRKLSTREGAQYRLPTEAEWEYSCRAGTDGLFSYGEGSPDDHAWYAKNAYHIKQEYAHLVATKEPNPWGLFDMHGNVCEWCQDWFDIGYYGNSPVDDPQGPAQGEWRIFRGGGWSNTQEHLRSAFRRASFPDLRRSYLGFRIVRELPDPATSQPKPPPVVAAAGPPQGDLNVCGSLSTDGPPVGMNPAAVHFTSNANSRNGFQYLIPGWKAWSGNEWQFQMSLGGSAGRGCFVIQPVRFGHFTVKIRQDGCDVFMMRQWPDPDMVAHASVKTSAAGDIFPLERGRAYLVSSRIDELGDYVLSIDGKPVLKSLLPLVREYIVDGRAMRGLPPGPVRPMAFSSASRFRGDGLHLKWPPGSGGVVVDYATEGTISASNVHLTLTTPTSASPVAESLKKGLVVWYRLDNVQGRTVTDASGNNHNGAASGDLRPVPGISGGGAAIDDETLITVGEVAAFDWNKPFTLSGWIRPEALDGTRYVFRKRNDSAKGYTLMLRRVTLAFGAASGIGGNMLGMYADKGAIMLRQWSHVAVVYDGSGRKLSVAMYVDGRQVRYENTSGTLSASMTVPDPLRIGRAFVGQLDDLRVYDRMLTNEEITFLAAPDRN